MGESVRRLWCLSPLARFLAVFALVAAPTLFVTSAPPDPRRPPRPTSVSLSGGRASVFGDPVIVTVEVRAPGETPTGSVGFRLDGAAFGAPVALVDGRARLELDGLPAGDHALSAVYGGGPDFEGSTTPSALSLRVEPDLADLRIPPGPVSTRFGLPVPVTVEVRPRPPGRATPTGFLQVKENGVLRGRAVPLQGGRAGLDLAPGSEGLHDLTIEYVSDTPNFLGVSATLLVSVEPQAPATRPPVTYHPDTPALAGPGGGVSTEPAPAPAATVPRRRLRYSFEDFDGTWFKFREGSPVNEVTFDRGTQECRELTPGRPSVNFYEFTNHRLYLYDNTIGQDGGRNLRVELGRVEWDPDGRRFTYSVSWTTREGEKEGTNYEFRLKTGGDEVRAGAAGHAP